MFNYEILNSNKTLINGLPAFEFMFKGHKQVDDRLKLKEPRFGYFISIIVAKEI